MRDFLTTLLHMKYHSSHELAVKNIFLSYFTEWKPTVRPRTAVIKSWLQDNDDSEMPPGSFLYQPCGSQNSPDFILRTHNGVIAPFECKSSKGTFPLYNSGGIKSNFIYIFASEKINATTLFLGKDIANPETCLLIEEHIKKQREQDEILNKQLKEIDSNQQRNLLLHQTHVDSKGYTQLLSDIQTDTRVKNLTSSNCSQNLHFKTIHCDRDC